MPAPPLGPDSLTWRYFGDARGLLFAVRAGVLQAMHPAIDAALRQHSDFFENPWNRLLRSAPPILGVVYDGPRAADRGTWVRDQHRAIKGDDRGRRELPRAQPGRLLLGARDVLRVDHHRAGPAREPAVAPTTRSASTTSRSAGTSCTG